MSALARPSAVAARVENFEENAVLRLTSKHGSTLNERGTSTGTYAFSPLTITFTSVSAEHGVATLVGYIHNTYLSGRANVNYYTSGPITHFEGSLVISRGNGIFAHARSAGLKIKGIINRHDFRTDAHASGKLSL